MQCRFIWSSSWLQNDYYLQSEGSISVLEHLEYIKHLGVTFDSKLKFDHQINEKANKSYYVLGLINWHI